jgi:hypothetical protein
LDSPIDRGLTATEAYTPSGGYASLGAVSRELTAQTIRSLAWAIILIAGTASVAAALWFDGYRLPPLWEIGLVGLIAALAERKAVFVTNRTTTSVSRLPLVFAAIAFGPLGGMAVGAISNILDIRDSRLKWVVYTPIRALTAATAGIAAWMFIPHPSGLAQYLLTSLAASLADLVADGRQHGYVGLMPGTFS